MRGPNIIATLTWPLGRRKRCVTFAASSVVPTVSGQLKVGRMGRGQGSSKELGVCQIGTEAQRLEQEERPREHESRAEEAAGQETS